MVASFRFGFTLGAGSLGKMLGCGRMNLYGVVRIFAVIHLSISRHPRQRLAIAPQNLQGAHLALVVALSSSE